jgi:hypothetical protein
MLTQSSDILQRFAVAWEQVVFENIPFVSSNKDQFADTQMRLKQVNYSFIKYFVMKCVIFLFSLQTLCVLDTVLAGKGMNSAANPTRSVMPDELRNLNDGSDRNIRNFRIIKDYINALEYFAEGFDYFASEVVV